MCDNRPELNGGKVLSDLVYGLRRNTMTIDNPEIKIDSHYFDFQTTQLNLTYARLANCTENSIICSLCSQRYFNCK
jgi:hypothetical protein